MSVLPYLVGAWLLLVGLYGIVTSRNLIHLTMCLAVVQSSTYVLLLSVGYRWDATVPVFKSMPPNVPVVDPVVAAMVLTDVVVGATVTALLLAIAVQVRKRVGSLDPADLRSLRK
jgi:multicomponent Na+:H+ antiporter subunit C